jgi:hypothetical protein
MGKRRSRTRSPRWKSEENDLRIWHTLPDPQYGDNSALAVDLPFAYSSARLPVVYEEARLALERCDRIDECKSWANKAEAMASYARMAGDESLHKFADRIQARAYRRCGELLKQTPASKGGRPPGNAEAQPPELTRTQAAQDAGLSKDQQKTALRIANLLDELFNQLVDSDNPPSVTTLAELGTKKKPLPNGVALDDYLQARETAGFLRRFAQFCTGTDPVRTAQGVTPKEAHEFRKFIHRVDGWLRIFFACLPQTPLEDIPHLERYADYYKRNDLIEPPEPGQ